MFQALFTAPMLMMTVVRGVLLAMCVIPGAPEFFAEDDNGNAYLKKQPTTPDEIALCIEQMDACPVNSIGKNG